MSDKHKIRILIGGVVILFAALLLGGKKGGAIINQSGDVSFGDIGGNGGLSIGGRQPFVINMPTSPARESLNVIGSCCMDCATPRLSTPQPMSDRLTLITNLGDNGPNIFNYYGTPTQPPPTQRKITMVY